MGTWQDPMKRFWKFANVQSEGCWNWLGATTDNGYGAFVVHIGPYAGRGAHRFSHKVFKGPIPEGTHVDHLCKNRKCVNPLHLEAVSVYENVVTRSDGLSARNARATHCVNGHLLPNPKTNSKGKLFRQCMTCCYERTKRYRKIEKLLRQIEEFTE